MFYDDRLLTNLDLSSFNISKVTDTKYMFSSCYNLITIYVSDLWDVSSITSSEAMFKSSSKIIGKVSYDSTKTDVSMANYTTGYLTYKKNTN